MAKLDAKKRLTMRMTIGKPKLKDTSMSSKGSMFNKFENPAMDKGTSDLANPAEVKSADFKEIDKEGPSKMKEEVRGKYKKLLEQLGK